jgi:predicted YcjX-like family ATPase
MPPSFSEIVEETRLAARALADFGSGLFNPTLRLGVTGLSRSGKTIFITALVHALLKSGGRFPVFEALAGGRIARARLTPQPDQNVPRFDYEGHLKALTVDRVWPHSTRRISELRVVIDYQSNNGVERTLTLDIVDYPGEWLLDLPLLDKSYAEWSAEALALSRVEPRKHLAAQWHAYLATLDPDAPQDEQVAMNAAKLFTDYIRACRDERYAMSLLPPGRFLMPGDLEGSPALTFAPLERNSDSPPAHSMWALMQSRYEAYKDIVVRPFFREHFARLDRQVVLVDALAALNAGPRAVSDLEQALAGVLDCFQIGRNTWLSALIRPRVDKLLFAATKADHLHHTSHDRLEAILRRMMRRAVERAEFSGATVDVVAIAAIRATREASVGRGMDTLPAIVGTPLSGERLGSQVFDGKTDIAQFPGDLPADPDALYAGPAFRGLTDANAEDAHFRFLRFRPPAIGKDDPLPHIRLDRALQFLIGDRLT